MVKVVELTKKEIEERERISKLIEITRDVFPTNDAINFVGGSIFIIPDSTINDSICVCPYRNLINVPNRHLFDYALNLAEEYEKRGESEFTVKKEYQSSSILF